MEELIGRLLAQFERDMKDIKPDKIPLSVAILTDKAALLSGRPTSMSATLTLKGNFNAEEIKARLTGKAPKTVKATVTESRLVETESQEARQSVSPPAKSRQLLPSSLATVDPTSPYASEPDADMQSSVADAQTTEDQHT